MYKISPNIIVEISSNGLEGYITITDTVIGENKLNEKLTVDETIEKIKEIIKYGLDEEKLRDILTSNAQPYKMCIARGVSPIDGEDGYIKYNFDLEKKIKPKILEDGTVDYRELDVINNVTAGEVLAEIIPPKEGRPGIRVTGEEIPYKKGKVPLLKYGKNVRMLESGKAIVAEKSGLVTLIDGKVVVLDVLNIDNVDSRVGNIYFDGTVVVRGNVLNGFKVEADGDVQVNGVVEGGYIENTGDVIIKKGIQGYNKLVIQTKGNLSAKFIENSIVSAKNNITAEVIMHSQVSCKESINLIGKKGLIVGGVCRAGKEIKAKNVGSIMSTTTVLEVGLDPEVKDTYERLIKEIEELEDNLNKIEKSIVILERKAKTSGLDRDKQMIYEKLLRSREGLKTKHNELKDEQSIIEKEIKYVSKGRIIVTNIVYPGVKIVIGNSTMIVRNEMKNCLFYQEEGEIKIAPYWE